MAEERFDAIVVGGGLAGLSAAYRMAMHGLEVALIERGERIGSKTVTGGRLYTHSIKKLFPNFPGDAHVERPVNKEVLGVLVGRSSLTMEFRGEGEPQSFTVLRARFDQWLGEKLEDAGAMVITGYRVDDLIMDGGAVKGVVAGGDELYSDVVIAADGANSMLAEKAGLRGRYSGEDIMLGIKEVVKLPSEFIEERFGLGRGEGAAHLYIGDFTMGIAGGAFLYTNRESVSVGVAIKLDSAISAVERNPDIYSYEILDRFVSHPHISRLLEGGRVVEYSAHIIPEPREGVIRRLCGDGILVVGDAAGLTISTPFMLRGMDLAIESGIAAADTVKEAHDIGRFDSKTLSSYRRRLSGLIKEVNRFSAARRLISNPKYYSVYPSLLVETLEEALRVDGSPKEHLNRILSRKMREKRLSLISVLLDLWRMYRAF